VDSEKILLSKKTDHKTMAELLYQYQHAPLYMDRFEAFQAAVDQPSTTEGKEILKAALTDKYHGLRVKAIRAIKSDDATLMAAILPTIANLAKNDPNYPVRAAAITLLGKTNLPVYKDLYQSSLASPSYGVRGAALIALNTVAPEQAFKTAKELQPKAEGPVAQAIVGVYASNGSDAEWPFVIDAFKKASVQGKVDNAIKTLPKIIGKMTNRAYVTEGITAIRDLAIAYKKYNIAPRLITALEQIGKDRKAINDNESVKVVEEAIREINEAKG
jgi:aminopeptidase N